MIIGPAPTTKIFLISLLLAFFSLSQIYQINKRYLEDRGWTQDDIELRKQVYFSIQYLYALSNKDGEWLCIFGKPFFPTSKP